MTTVEAVEQHLQTDLAMVDMLARGIANQRRTARWLIEQYGWDASEEAVVSALRRYAETHDTPPFTRTRDVLGETLVDVRTGLALMVLHRRRGVHRRLGHVWGAIDGLDTVSVFDGLRRIRILLEQKNIEAVTALFPAGSVEEVIVPVAAVQVKLPSVDEAVSILGHVVGALAHRQIQVLDVCTCMPECMVLVPEEITMEAYGAASSLIKRSEAK